MQPRLPSEKQTVILTDAEKKCLHRFKPGIFQEGGAVYYLNSEGEVTVWGENEYGQLGLGHRQNISTPTNIPNLKNIKNIFCTFNKVFFLDQEGQVYFCGYDSSRRQNVLSPIKLSIPAKIQHIVSNNGDTFFVDETNYLWGYGNNDSGTLGLGHANPVTTITQIPTQTPISKVYAEWFSGYMIDTNGNVMGSGSNRHEKLGLGPQR